MNLCAEKESKIKGDHRLVTRITVLGTSLVGADSPEDAFDGLISC